MMARLPAAILFCLVAAYCVLGLLVLSPDAVYSGDIGVKFVEARALASHRFASLDIPYPGERLDPAREYFPMRPPFVMSAAGRIQSIFSPVSTVVQAVAVAAAGLRGLIALSIIGAAVTLYAAVRMTPSGLEAAVLVALGIGSPLWFYAVSGWEHAPAVALTTCAFSGALLAPPRVAAIASGVLVGIAATLRDEAFLMLPGVLVALWIRNRLAKPVLAAAVSALVPLVAAAALEVWWFERPVAAHLRHAVHLVQKAAHLTSEPNPELPVREALTPRQRYETIVQYWLLGYGNDRIIVLCLAGLAAALLLRVAVGTSIGVLVWLGAIVALASLDLWDVMRAPKWVAGLLRVAPYLVFAILPRPPSADRMSSFRVAVLWAAAAYLIVAAVGVDTSGGKSLGPRLLLPLLPLLAVSAVVCMFSYLRAPSFVDRAVGGVGVGLVAIAAAIHATGTVPAYLDRNRDDAAAIRAAASVPETWVVADEEFTAQLLLPLYYGKIILLADTPGLGRSVAARLDANHVTRFIVVSRRATAQMSLRPYDLERIEPAGRMSIQYWQR